MCGLEGSPYTPVVTGRAVRRAKAPTMTLMWTATTVPSKGQAFHLNHIVLLAERPGASQVIGVDDRTATFDYDGYDAAGADVSACEEDDNDASLTTDAESSNSDCAQMSADENSKNDTIAGL